LSFDFTFRNDKYEGVQRTYFENGQPWQMLNYLHGREEGKQKSWNDSGRVVNNFTVKDGKLYGVIGRYDCMSAYKK
jgi:antitoxin component YwqK of YwqJK toxin-antitoxin module